MPAPHQYSSQLMAAILKSTEYYLNLARKEGQISVSPTRLGCLELSYCDRVYTLTRRESLTVYVVAEGKKKAVLTALSNCLEFTPDTATDLLETARALAVHFDPYAEDDGPWVQRQLDRAILLGWLTGTDYGWLQAGVTAAREHGLTSSDGIRFDQVLRWLGTFNMTGLDLNKADQWIADNGEGGTYLIDAHTYQNAQKDLKPFHDV